MTLSGETRSLLQAARLDEDAIRAQVQGALDEDLAYGPDLTTQATVPANQRVRARFAARQAGVLSGVPVVSVVLDLVVGPERWARVHTGRDGDHVDAGGIALEVEAPTRELLTAERTALNFLCHMSGVATVTAQWVAAVAGTSVLVRDTRKTTPGLRVLDKYAVRCGGGVNHRMGLGDAALVKDNHVLAAGGVAEAVAAVRSLSPNISLEVECDSLDQVMAAVAANVSLVLLDNMSVDQIREVAAVVHARPGHVKLEASGGLTLESVRRVAETGVDFVAVGALTHSAPVLDLGLDVTKILERVTR